LSQLQQECQCVSDTKLLKTGLCNNLIGDVWTPE
jgi:hypothetical protein